MATDRVQRRPAGGLREARRGERRARPSLVDGVPALERLVLRLAPSVVTAVITTTLISATMRPYSMAVAPDRSLRSD
jgi:hypothetical protein